MSTRSIISTTNQIATFASHQRPPFPHGWSSLPLGPSSLCLANTLPVGQSFLWHRTSVSREISPLVEEYSRAIDYPPRVICLRQTDQHIYYTAIHVTDEDAALDIKNGTTRRWLEDYFQLRRFPDLESLYESWSLRDQTLFGSAQHPIGVRVLRQDPWECLVAFITSSNNHIPRITSLMHRLSQQLMPPLLSLDNYEEGVTMYHLFPSPCHFPDDDSEAVLRKMGFGYRAVYLDSSLRSLKALFGSHVGAIEKGLESWRQSPVDEAREQLMKLKGVGRKVADCVLLMSLDKESCIPIDTHIGAIAARHPAFPRHLRNKAMSKQVYEDIQKFLTETWGPLGGWCQAVMFASDLPKVAKEVKASSPSVKLEIDSPDKKADVPESSPFPLSTAKSEGKVRPRPSKLKKRTHSSMKSETFGDNGS